MKYIFSKQFNEIYFNLLTYLIQFIDNETNKNDFLKFIDKNLTIKKINPSIFIRKWYEYITTRYYNEIIFRDNINVFIYHNYSSDIQNEICLIDNKTLDSMLKYINIALEKYNCLDENIQHKIIYDIKQLTILSYNYIN